ncbi:FAD-dependent oxidoreductase [Alcanivorax sp. JB21]|uniref:FAD-dependent oxidoreductase n=1 Tax=Alcanivorax limicola TaxID=2874102 RepID=UPI001CBF8CB1|nr:FAD-dependent oxidoreductase [Alcanivorax limicola]MBZ2188422.1 FAD-dependent oxidoreductase [Alcanivorax limicola]
MNRQKALILALIVAALAVFFWFDLGRFLTLEYLRSSLDGFQTLYSEHRVLTLVVFFVIYVAVTGLSLPGAAIMTLAAGAFFGLVVGTLLVSFASSLGATIAFLVSRLLLQDSVQRRFGERLKPINEGVRKDGAFYLFTLRLVPAFPFFVINLVMGLTPIRTWTFYWVSQVGMLAGTLVYVNAGTQLAVIESPGDLLSPGLIGAFVLLGLFPWIARGIMGRVQAMRVYAGWKKPEKFDANIAVIGAGSAGLVTAYIGAAVKAKVVLVERDRMGGDCLNTGCVPSKTLIKSARVQKTIAGAGKYGITTEAGQVDFAAVMQRVQRVISKIAPHDSVERYSELGVDCRQGQATIISPWEIDVTHAGKTQRITAKNIVIASGGEPAVPPIPGLTDMDYLTSDSLWSLQSRPQRLLVLGGGPIGCELAQSFAGLGSEVTLVEMAPRLLLKEDEDAAAAVTAGLAADGVQVLTGFKAVRFRREGTEQWATVEGDSGARDIAFDQVLVALGRRARTQGLGLETLGIELSETGTVAVDEYLRTRYPNIYACGDVAGPYQFTHVAAHQAWYVAVNALFGRLKKFKVDYSVIPWCTFTSPEVARVGLSEAEATAQGVAFEVTRYGIDDLDRAIADGTDEGFVKVLTRQGTDRILGVTIVGEHAGDLIAEYVLAMRHGLGLNKILGTIHIYPTLAEANKFAAGEWKKAHAPQGLLRWVERFHRWSRS